MRLLTSTAAHAHHRPTTGCSDDGRSLRSKRLSRSARTWKVVTLSRIPSRLDSSPCDARLARLYSALCPLRRCRRALSEGDLAWSCLAVAADTSASSAGAPVNEPIQSPSIADLVVAGLANGLLWILEADPVWAGHGTLKPCVVCGVKIHNYEIQYDVVGPRGSLPVHVKCYRIWRGHSDKQTRDM